MNQNNNENHTTEPSKRIALIEDDSTVMDIIKDFLKDEGYDYEFYDSVEKFHMSNTEFFNVIISDINK